MCGRKQNGWRPCATVHCTPSSTCSPSTMQSGLCRYVCVMSFKRWLTPSCVVFLSCFDANCNAVACLSGRKRNGWQPRATTHCTPSSTCLPSTTKCWTPCCWMTSTRCSSGVCNKVGSSSNRMPVVFESLWKIPESLWKIYNSAEVFILFEILWNSYLWI